MGRGTDRRRALVEDRHSDFPANGPALYADGTEASRNDFQRWMTFVRNHAKAIIAFDFFIVATATFRLVYVFVIMEIATRRILHFNTTCHPTAEWTLQQFRECVTGEEPYN